MGAPQKADWRAERRKRAWALKQQGWLQKDIAAALGVSEGAVSQWLKRAREAGGIAGWCDGRRRAWRPGWARSSGRRSRRC